MNESKKAEEALNEIAEIVSNATGSTDGENMQAEENGTNGTGKAQVGCSIKSLPDRLSQKGAETAMKVNPVNAAQFSVGAALPEALVSDPQFLTLLTTKYWGPMPRRLTVSFMEPTPADLRRRILLHMNAWNRTTSFSFAETGGTGNIRISRGGGGYWSYLGTDVLLIPPNRPTMNLQGFTMNTSEAEYRRVVRHETGHTMGFPHEHMRRELVNRIDPQKAYAYFLRTQGWSRQMVDQQVLTPLDVRTIIGTPADQTSIMCYQLPASITRDGRPITGGADINATDFQFAGRVYPKLPGFNVSNKPSANVNDWPESDDLPDTELDELINSIISKTRDLELEG